MGLFSVSFDPILSLDDEISPHIETAPDMMISSNLGRVWNDGCVAVGEFAGADREWSGTGGFVSGPGRGLA